MEVPDRGHCLHLRWPCFQEPRSVLAGSPVPLRSRTGPSLHLPRSVDSDHRENNKCRPCMTSRREHPKSGRAAHRAREPRLARPQARGSASQRQQGRWDTEERPGEPCGTGSALRPARRGPPGSRGQQRSLPVLRSPAAPTPRGPGSPRPGPPAPPPAAPPRSCSTAPPAWAVHRGRSARAALGSPSCSPAPAAPPPQRRYLRPATARRRTALGAGAAAARPSSAAPIQAGSRRRRVPAAMPTRGGAAGAPSAVTPTLLPARPGVQGSWKSGPRAP